MRISINKDKLLEETGKGCSKVFDTFFIVGLIVGILVGAGIVGLVVGIVLII